MSKTQPVGENDRAVDVEQEPHHQLVLVNDAVRVFWVEIGEGDVSLMHRHHYDYVTVVIGDAVIGNRKLGHGEERQVMQHGDMFFSRAGLEHQVRNAGETPFRNFVISVLLEGQTGAASMVSRLVHSGAKVELKMQEPHVSAARLTLEKEEARLVGEGLVIPLENSAVEISGGAGHLRMGRVGDFAWVSGITRVKSEGKVELAVVEVR